MQLIDLLTTMSLNSDIVTWKCTIINYADNKQDSFELKDFVLKNQNHLNRKTLQSRVVSWDIVVREKNLKIYVLY